MGSCERSQSTDWGRGGAEVVGSFEDSGLFVPFQPRPSKDMIPLPRPPTESEARRGRGRGILRVRALGNGVCDTGEDAVAQSVVAAASGGAGSRDDIRKLTGKNIAE